MVSLVSLYNHQFFFWQASTANSVSVVPQSTAVKWMRISAWHDELSCVLLSSARLFQELDTTPTWEHCLLPFFFSECCHQVVKKSLTWDTWDVTYTHIFYCVYPHFFFLWFMQVVPVAKRHLSLQARKKKDRNKDEKDSGVGYVSHNSPADKSCTGLLTARMRVFSFISPLCSIICHL